jgi:hypothetical protein
LQKAERQATGVQDRRDFDASCPGQFRLSGPSLSSRMGR